MINNEQLTILFNFKKTYSSFTPKINIWGVNNKVHTSLVLTWEEITEEKINEILSSMVVKGMGVDVECYYNQHKSYIQCVYNSDITKKLKLSLVNSSKTNRRFITTIDDLLSFDSMNDKFNQFKKELLKTK